MNSNSTPPDYFELFELPATVELDRGALERAYQALQARWHPDQFAGGEAAARSRAVRQTSLVNDAYQTLRSPVKRAAHLLALRGVDPEKLEQRELAPDFLMAQIQWREQLEQHSQAADEAKLVALASTVEVEFDRSWQAFGKHLAAGALADAKKAFHELQFLGKLQDEISEAEAALLDD